MAITMSSSSGLCWKLADIPNDFGHNVRAVPVGAEVCLFTDLQHQKADSLLQQIYRLYADYVLKNPFYTLEMPVANSCQKFVTEVQKLISILNPH